MTDERLNDLETSMIYQEKQIEDLSNMVSKQWQEIDSLKKLLGRATSRINELENQYEEVDQKSITDIASAEKPPHY